MHESLGSQLLRTTIRILSIPDNFDALRLVMPILSSLRASEVLFRCRLVLEGKAGKEILDASKLEFFGKFSTSNFALPDVEDNTSGSLNKGVIADLPLLRTLVAIHQKPWKQSFLEVIASLFS